MSNLRCDGEKFCFTGDYLCDDCEHYPVSRTKVHRPVNKKPKLDKAPPKVFKRRKK